MRDRHCLIAICLLVLLITFTEGARAEWTADGNAVCNATNSQYGPGIVSDGSGAVLFAWEDGRSGIYDIYAQRVETQHGYWGNLEPVLESVSDIPEDQGGFVTVEWDASGRDTYRSPSIFGYSVWRSTSSATAKGVDAALLVDDLSEIGPDFEGPAYRIEATKTGDYRWEWLAFQTAHHFPGYSFTAPTRHDSTAIDPGTHYFQVVAHVVDQHVWWASDPVSGFSVDNLAPGAPMQLLGKREECDVALDWNRSIENAEDLNLYRIYRDTESGFDPAPELLVGTALDTTFLDADPEHTVMSYYIVTAIDIHGNEGNPSNEVFMTPSTGVPDAPGVFRLAGNMPNPFNPSTRIAYEIPGGASPGHVLLRIYDTAGRTVRTLVDGPQAAGSHESIWDGTGDQGTPVGSGVYTCRLEWNKRSETRRMVLVR